MDQFWPCLRGMKQEKRFLLPTFFDADDRLRASAGHHHQPFTLRMLIDARSSERLEQVPVSPPSSVTASRLLRLFSTVESPPVCISPDFDSWRRPTSPGSIQNRCGDWLRCLSSGVRICRLWTPERGQRRSDGLSMRTDKKSSYRSRSQESRSHQVSPHMRSLATRDLCGRKRGTLLVSINARINVRDTPGIH